MANGAYTMNTTVKRRHIFGKIQLARTNGHAKLTGRAVLYELPSHQPQLTAGITAVYRIGQLHEISVNNVFNAFRRTKHQFTDSTSQP